LNTDAYVTDYTTTYTSEDINAKRYAYQYAQTQYLNLLNYKLQEL
jgi:hypothetical protein